MESSANNDPVIAPEEERLRQLLVNGRIRKSTGEWLPGILRERNRHKQLNVPFPHQRKVVYEMMAKDVEFFGYYHDMGLGKTVGCCMGIAGMYLQLGLVPKTLIACPAGLVRHWKKDLLGWLNLPEDRFLFVEKGSQLTYAALNDADIVVVSRELVSKAFGESFIKVERAQQIETDAGMRWVSAWLRRDGVPLHPLYCSGFRTETDEAGVEQRVEVNREFHLFFADEAHDLRRAGSQRTNAFKEMSARCHKRIPITGTPILHRQDDIAAQCLAMGMPTIGGTDFTKPSSWICDKDYTRLNEKTNKKFQKFVNRVTEDMLDLPPMVHTAVSYDVNVPEDKVQEYNDRIDAVRALRLAFERNPQNITNSDVARLMAMIQEAQFMTICPMIAEYGASELHKNKSLLERAAAQPTGALNALLAELRLLQTEGHMRIVVSSMHTSVLHVAAKFLERVAPDLGKQWFYDGEMSTKKRDDSKHEFLSCRVGLMFLSIAAGGQGVHMVPGCEAMVLFGSSPWSNGQVDQVCKRIHRLGQTCPNTGSVQIRRLVGYGTVEAAVSAIHGCKRRLQKMTVDTWATATAARDDESAQARKRRKKEAEDAADDDDADATLQTKWRQTGRVVDLCHKLNEDGNFGEMPLVSVDSNGEETGVYTVVPGVITRGREGELPPDPTPVPDAVDPPAANPQHAGGFNNLAAPNWQELLGPGVQIPPLLQNMIDAAQGPGNAIVPMDVDLGGAAPVLAVGHV